MNYFVVYKTESKLFGSAEHYNFFRMFDKNNNRIKFTSEESFIKAMSDE